MARKLSLKMVKQNWNKGFTLIEVLLVLAVLAITTLIVIPLYKIEIPSKLISMIYQNELILLQQDSMINAKTNRLETEDGMILGYHQIKSTINISDSLVKINEKGNVNLANTISFSNSFSNCDVVIWIGCGRSDIKIGGISDD